MISRRCLFTSIFVATSALITEASAENVYKCGSTYSQVPCPGGKLLSVDDSRDLQQKKLKDEITQRDAALAREMEQDRLTKEEALRVTEAKHPVAHKTPTKKIVAQDESALVKLKRFKHKTAKNLGFVAEVPGSRPQPVKKKQTKKTGQEAQP